MGVTAGAGLAAGFLRSAQHTPQRPAVQVGGQEIAYGVLLQFAAAVAATLQQHGESAAGLTAVFAARSLSAYGGILGALLRGTGYVPLNPAFPAGRTREMLLRSRSREIVVDAAAAPLLPEVLHDAPPGMLVVLPEDGPEDELRAALPGHRVLGPGDLTHADAWAPRDVDPWGIAYLLFTSGSTGVPKGVVVAHRNVRAFLDVVVPRWEIDPGDRLSQMFDLTFDVSVADMFMAWEAGACVCCPSAAQVRKPGRYIRDSRLSVWYSVPSVAMFMRRFGELGPGRYPGLRLSVFAGEALPERVALDWARAAPNGILENTYGPTETTIVVTGHRWSASPGREPVNGIVPIGTEFPGSTAFVADQDLMEVPPGEAGELLVAGPQVALGYWDDPEATARGFVVPPGRTERHYRTGDRVRRPDGHGPMAFLGRLDGQVQVLGHRVELGEVEAAIRRLTGTDEVVALGWPPTDAGVGGIVCFVAARDLDVPALRRAAADVLPDYMVPRDVRCVDALPLNANGKFDRPALLGLLEGR
ncbi:MAG: AMP-binding protein [Thermoleophilia bacterium]|nr:AMP-binding protein [Thermoleophilia bacterium]